MRRLYSVSICREGVLGGSLRIEDHGLRYRTNKLTVSPMLRDLFLAFSDIREIRPRWWLIFPLITVEMRDGERYSFILFGQRAFFRALSELGQPSPNFP